MFEAAWAQALPYGIHVTPGLRYYTQSAADFYYNPPFPRGYRRRPGLQRRHAARGVRRDHGGVTVGKTLWDGWSVALRADYYRQDPDWRIGGSGSPGIQTFSARWLEVEYQPRRSDAAIRCGQGLSLARFPVRLKPDPHACRRIGPG